MARATLTLVALAAAWAAVACHQPEQPPLPPPQPTNPTNVLAQYERSDVLDASIVSEGGISLDAALGAMDAAAATVPAAAPRSR